MKNQIHAVTTWARPQPPKVNAFLGVASAMAALAFLGKIAHDHDHDDFFVATEAVHALGISALIYKLAKEMTIPIHSIHSLQSFFILSTSSEPSRVLSDTPW